MTQMGTDDNMAGAAPNLPDLCDLWAGWLPAQQCDHLQPQANQCLIRPPLGALTARGAPLIVFSHGT